MNFLFFCFFIQHLTNLQGIINNTESDIIKLADEQHQKVWDPSPLEIEMYKLRMQPRKNINLFELNPNDPNFEKDFMELHFYPTKNFKTIPDEYKQIKNIFARENKLPISEETIDGTALQDYFENQDQKNQVLRMFSEPKDENDKIPIAAFYRFTELQEKHKSFQKSNKKIFKLKDFVKSPKQEVPIIDCYASSIFEQSYSQFMNETFQTKKLRELPCPDQNDNKPSGAWNSAPLKKKDEIVTLGGKLANFQRIGSLLIDWEMAPKEARVLSSVDGKNWITNSDWKKCQSYYTGNGQWWKQFAFPQLIQFDVPAFIQEFKIEMKNPIFKNQIAIFNITAYTQVFVVQFRSQMNPDSCIVRQDINYDLSNEEIGLMMCTDAISLGDGRELFVIKMDFTIRSFVDNYCMVVEDGEIKDRMPVILEDETNINDDRNMWKFAGHGAIKWFKDETMCMAYAKNDKEDIAEYDGHTCDASSNVENCNKALNDDKSSFWVSQEGQKNSFFEINFNDKLRTFSEIFIKWKHIPKQFEIQFRYMGTFWQTYYQDNENIDDDLELRFPFQTAFGVRIQLMDFGKNEKNYGITSLSVERGTQGVVIRPCRQGFNSMYWNVDEVNFIDLWPYWYIKQPKLCIQFKTYHKNIREI